MKIFITGSTGFIGGQLLPHLLKKHEVYALIRRDHFQPTPHHKEAHLIEGDLLSPSTYSEKLREVRPDIVVHLASITPVRYSFSNPLQYSYTNYIGTVGLIEAIKELNLQQFVFASTMEVYRAKNGTLSEEDPLEGSTPYGVSKAAADLYVQMAGRAWRIPYTILRPGNTFGRPYHLPEEAKGYLVEKAVIGMLTQQVVEFDGYPDRVRSWLYYPDHISAYLSVIGNEKAAYKIYNVATEPHSVGEVVEMIRELTDFKGEIRWGRNPRPYDPPMLMTTAERIKMELKWRPKYSVYEGLQQTVSYWREALRR